jgi:predicted DNA-binding WGR domain protein
MSEEKIYLELSEAEGSSHKFYEVTIQDLQVTIRYGRIGDPGQTKVSSYATAEKAKTAATKKVNEKLRKGYEHAVQGVRKKRAITRRSIESQRSTANPSPILWKFNSGAPAFGIFINATHCWVGNQSGNIFTITHAGEVVNQFQLPDGVKCIVADEDWLYAGCDNGKVYDLTGKVPRVAYEIAENVDIFWLDIHDGILGVSDREGRITTINHEDESQWTRQSRGDYAWMVRCDEIGVYHGHSQGVAMYDWEDGSLIWSQPTQGAVLFGWQEDSTLYAGTGQHQVYCFTKQGERSRIYQCDAPIYSCAAAEDGKYVFAGDSCSSIYCFSQTGERLWKLATGCGSAFSMQFLQDRLYVVTTDGTLACIDASESAIQAAQAGTVPQAKTIKDPKLTAIAPSTELETVSTVDRGVVVECIQENGRLRVRATSSGYNMTWNVQFPRELREVGSRYLVDELRESSRGGFYPHSAG